MPYESGINIGYVFVGFVVNWPDFNGGAVPPLLVDDLPDVLISFVEYRTRPWTAVLILFTIRLDRSRPLL